MNLGLGRGLSVLEVIAAVARVTGRPVPWNAADRRAGAPPILVADPELARRRLGWRPLVEDIDEIVANALAWRLNPQLRPAALCCDHVA